MNDVIHKRLGIAEEHQRLVEIIYRIVDAGEARLMLRLMTMTVWALSKSRIGTP